MAKLVDVSPSEIEVSVLEEANVPGIAVFSTYRAPPRRGRPGRYSYGVAAEDIIEINPKKAMSMVLEAWKYGPERTVPPEQVARVFGLFEGQPDDPARPFLTQAQIDEMRAEQKAVMFLPRETTVDGKPAVEYWAASGEVPLWKTTAVIEPDRTVTLSIEEFWD